MKKLLLTLLITAVGASAATARLSLADQAMLRQQKMEQRGMLNAASPRKAAPAPGLSHITLAFIKLNSGFTQADLEAEGVTVNASRGGILLCSLPTNDVVRVAALDAVEQIELSKPMRANMDLARVASGVDKLHAGEALDQPYTGNGVIAGIVDQGMDPNHINFVNEDGSSRLGYLAHIAIDYTAPDGWSGSEYDRDNIWRFTTDTEETFHGTHTMGTLAGGYKGDIDAAVRQNTQLAEIKTIKNPYYGVATGADIAAGCGELRDMLIALSIDRILDYRYQEQKPCVLSLSIGSTTGSHNPKALMCQFLDEVAKECIVVLSAGNEGDIPLALKKTFTAEDKEAKTFILPTYKSDTRSGQVYLYSDKPFKFKGVVYNKTRKRIVDNMPVIDGQEQGAAQYYCSSDQVKSSADIVNATFNRYFNGYVGVGWDIDTYTGEYMALIDYYTVDNAEANANGNYIIGFVVEGEEGQHVEAYCNGLYTALDDYDQEGWDDGSTDGTISDMACGNDVIVVGAYNTRDDYPALDGFMYNYQGAFAPGKVTAFSSYGTLADGRTLPHVCAPGAAIISSCSKYYAESTSNGVRNNALNAKVTHDGRTSYWCPAMGTSMATPYVAGSIALWLEADPTLTTDAIKEIISTTSMRDADVEAGNPVQWGAGKFDAYAGLKEVLRRNSASVSDITADDSALMVKREGDNCTMFLAGADCMHACIYSLGGACVLEAEAAGDELAIDISALPKGVYVLNVNGIHSRKIIK